MLTTEEDARALLDDIEKGRLNSLEKIHKRIHTLHEQFERRQWVWVIRQLEEAYHKKVEEFTVEDLEQMVRDWIRAVEELDRLRCEDASKEFALTARIGFGIDGTQTERDADFEAIRGSAETNDFIVAVRQRLEAKQCPSFKRLHDRYRKPGFGASGGQLQDLNWTIGMNAYFCRGDMFNRIPNSGRRDHANRTAHIIFVEESEIRRPAETVLYGDKIAMDIAKADPDSGSDLLNISQQPYVYENAVGIRHGGHGANMGFCDGHVQYVEQETRSWQSWNGNGAAPGLKVWYPEVPQPLGVPRGSDATTYAWQDRVPQQQLIWNFQQPVNQQ